MVIKLHCYLVQALFFQSTIQYLIGKSWYRISMISVKY